MKALIVYPVDVENKNHQGLWHKQRGQVSGLSQNGITCDAISLKGHRIVLNDKVIGQIPPWLYRGLAIRFSFYRTIGEQLAERKYDLIILRHVAGMMGVKGFIKRMKKDVPACRIVLDLPTYPFEKEWKGVVGQMVLAVDAASRKSFISEVDLIIHPGAAVNIWNRPTIRIDNGYLTSDMGGQAEHMSSAGINLVAVGKWQFWHGLDRLIKGFHIDRKLIETKNVFLTVVGEGPERRRLMRLTGQLGLSSRIGFLGALDHSELPALLSRMDMGIGTLGIHRKGTMANASLKHRLYCANGLPIILSRQDEGFPQDLPFVLYVPDNDAPISLSELISFYERARTVPGLRNEIRHYALSNFGWSSRMSEVLETLDLVEV